VPDHRRNLSFKVGVNAGEIRPGIHAYELMREIGDLCIGRDSDPRYDPRRLVELLLQGIQRPRSS
jgi:hypothetical protein